MTDPELKDLWKAEEQNIDFDLGDIRKRAAELERTIRNRNLREWIAALAGVPVFAWMGLRADEPLVIAGAFVVVAAAFFVSAFLWKFGRLRQPIDPSTDTAAFLERYSTALRDQARLLGQAPLWYVAPIACGLFLMHFGRMPAPGETWTIWIAILCFFVFVMVSVALLNVYTAKDLARQADRLR